MENCAYEHKLSVLAQHIQRQKLEYRVWSHVFLY